MTAREVLDRASIANAWTSLGGGPLRYGRGAAWWRDGDGHNVSLDESKGVWYDHARSEGGGVLNLVQTVLGCDGRAALHWLADHQGVELNDRPPTRAERRQWAVRRCRAEVQAKELVRWRAAYLDALRDSRNALWDAERNVSEWARAHLNNPSMADDSRWGAVWKHAFDTQRGGQLDAEIARVKALEPVDLVAFRQQLERRAA